MHLRVTTSSLSSIKSHQKAACLLTGPFGSICFYPISSPINRGLTQRIPHRSISPTSVANQKFATMSTSGVAPQQSTSAYIEHANVQGTSTGPLAGKRVAVKDLFDIKGQRTGFGHPLWRKTHAPARATAPVVEQLLEAGASVQGRTHMDELAYSLNGENFHYGTPRNAAAPGRVPGGSSSGSAAAVAAGDVEVGLGSDTGGSIRIPASYCGLFGIRPTHGRVSLEGARPLAPSFDTAGWLTRTMEDLHKVGNVLLPPSSAPHACSQEAQQQQQQPLVRLLIGTDAFALADAPTGTAVQEALLKALAEVQPQNHKQQESQQQQQQQQEQQQGSHSSGWSGLCVEEVQVAVGHADLTAAGLGSLSLWLDVFRVCQAAEIWQVHGPWIQQHKPQFGPGVKERFEMASRITLEEWQAAQAMRQTIQRALSDLLGLNGILALPTAPGPAPLCNTPAEQLNDWRTRMLSLTCIAGLAGLPQISLPVASVEGGLPVGLSLIGPKGKDEILLKAAARLAAASGLR